MKRRWDIFCSVVDNFGDIGVCWRLARQLSLELGQAVRLWVDDPASFHRLCAGVNPALDLQQICGVDVRVWRAEFPPVEPSDIVVEGFGARLPESFVARMAEREPRPVWINLEYLSAEPWVDGCHGLSSPHATLPLARHFFFPGFTPATGGLLIERELAAQRDAFQRDKDAIRAFWRSLGLTPPNDNARIVSLFCYDNAALAPLVEAWAADTTPVVCILPESATLEPISQLTGRQIERGTTAVFGKLWLHGVPFLELDRYDHLLWACDINFVRGEDSFVRAQLAARPLVWQAYPQENSVHLAKVGAFLDRYEEALEPSARAAHAAVSTAWNEQSADIGDHWRALCAELEALRGHARSWAEHLVQSGNLAQKLAEFCENRIK
jgi:uncharacterized repeat protein (TIGR03837 family)